MISAKFAFKAKKSANINSEGLKKFLYMEANDLKTTYNEIVVENKKLETKLKQIEKDKNRVAKQLDAVKKNSGAVYKEQLAVPEGQGLGVLNQNPNELKQRIRDKREIYDEHVSFYEELKVKTKTDNLLDQAEHVQLFLVFYILRCLLCRF